MPEPPPDATPEQAEAWGYNLISPAELAGEVPPLEWLIYGMWLEGSYGPLGGSKKTLKSYIAMISAIAVASGKDAFRNPEWAVPRERAVIYYAGEGGVRMHKRRLQRIAKEVYGIDNIGTIPLYVVPEIGPFDTREFWWAMQRNIDEINRGWGDTSVGLVVLDSLYHYHPSGVEVTNIYERGPMLASLNAPLTEQGISLWVVDHFNKLGKGIDLNRLAQAGMAAWSDSWWLMDHGSTPDVNNGRFSISIAIGSRHWGGEEWTLDIDIGRFNKKDSTYRSPMKVSAHESIRAVAAASPSTPNTEVEQVILEFLSEHPDEFTETGAQEAIAHNVTAGAKRIRLAWEVLAKNGSICKRPGQQKIKGGGTRKQDLWACAEASSDTRTYRVKGSG